MVFILSEKVVNTFFVVVECVVTNTDENMDFITDNLKVIILAIIGIFAGIGITIKIRNYKKDNSNKVTQKKNKVCGDMAGRDINK